MVSVPWWFINVGGASENPLDGWLSSRFERLESVLGAREWLAAGQFSIADILMADVLRMPRKMGALDAFPALVAYMDRALDRPAFKQAYDDQMAHFAAGDACLAAN